MGIQADSRSRIHRMAQYLHHTDSDSDSSEDEELKATRDIVISNSLDKRILVQILPVKLVMQTQLPDRQFGVGAGVGVGVGCLDPHVNIEFVRGSSSLTNYSSEVKSHTVAPHTFWTMKPPSKNIKKGKLRSREHWTNNMGVNRDPHLELKPRRFCKIC